MHDDKQRRTRALNFQEGRLRDDLSLEAPADNVLGAYFAAWRYRTSSLLVQEGRKRLTETVDFLISYFGGVEGRNLEPSSKMQWLDRKMCNEVMESVADALHVVCGKDSPLRESDRTLLASEVAARLQPALEKSGVARRMLTKSRGYAGDAPTIEEIYENVAYGETVLGTLIDRCVLDATTSRAVRSRRNLIAGKIGAEVGRHADRATRVLSIACGPAREVSDAFESLECSDQLQVECVDVDELAIESTRERMESEGYSSQVEFTCGNPLRLRSMKHIGEQDFVYSIGLIDYLSDKAVVQLLNQIHKILAPGGKVVLGTFHRDNKRKVFMDHILEWKLIHRSEADMHRLFQTSRFGRGCTDICYEETGINLFAECVKEEM